MICVAIVSGDAALIKKAGPPADLFEERIDLIGKGWREGTQAQLEFIPERHTDFIFASFAEEFGLLGIVLVLFAYFYLLYRFF